MSLQIVVDGQWLGAHATWGDLEWSTVWPGGSESLTFTAARSHRLLRPDALVELHDGGKRYWCGTLLEPTRGEPLAAEGLYRKGEDFPALNIAQDAAASVHEAVDAAIGRGLPWHRGSDGVSSPFDLSPEPLVNGAPALDLAQPHSVAQYLDASAQQRGGVWWVTPYRYVRIDPWPNIPTLHMQPGLDGLGVSRDGYACKLFARYLDSADNTFKTVTAYDEAAHARWGYAERTIPQVLGEGAAMPVAQAQALVDGLMAQGAPQIGWANPLEVQYGDVLTGWGQPVQLIDITEGQTIRLHGLEQDMADLAGASYADIPIARVEHKGDVATIHPRGLVSPMNDALAGVK